MKRPGLLLFFVALSMLFITGFQVYWIARSYEWEMRVLSRQLNMSTRETMLEFILPDGMMKKDIERMGLPGASQIIVHKVESSDSVLKNMDTTVLKQEHNYILKLPGGHGAWHEHRGHSPSYYSAEGDSGKLEKRIELRLMEPQKLREEIQKRLNEEYSQLKVEIITTRNPDSLEDLVQGIHSMPVPTNLEEKKFAIATVNGYQGALIKRILPQAGLSVFIVGLSLFSFLMLYRSLRSQQRITRQQQVLISNISHELKTPIATVSVALEALKNFNQLQNAEKTKEYLDISQKELGRLAMLTDNVLRLTMMELGELKLQLERVNLEQIATESANAMRLQAEKSGGTIAVDILPGNYEFTGDRLHLSSMIMNLLDNAIKYSAGPARVSLELKVQGELIVVAVKDKGIGIRKEHQSKVFEKFFRVMEGDEHNVKGFGLGLSYVAEIVKRHGGSIDLQSGSGEGSIFTVTLPKQFHG